MSSSACRYIGIVLCLLSLHPKSVYASPPTVAAREPSPRAAFAPVEQSLSRPVAAWIEYCKRHVDDCKVDLREPISIPLTPTILKRIKSINQSVNAKVRPLTDLEHWGVKDQWDQGEDGFGDCEDYQLLKRQLLVKAGVPRRVMLMTVAWDSDHNGHALLMIRTNIGDVILDNERNDIFVWSGTGYVFVKRESQYVAGWVPFVPSPTATASLR